MKKWIAAARLRTLPLAFSSILLGTFIASFYGFYNGLILALCLITTLLYQVLSNYANDYGDGVKGTDENRRGEKRAVASGDISASTMKRAVQIMAILSLISGTSLSILATRGLPIYVTIAFVLLGVFAVWAAIRYTVGNSAYGYKGFGDIYVMVFFGWLGVLGSFYLQAHQINYWVILPASAVGMMAMGVLNLNNMRDIEEDVKNGKRTIAARIGRKSAKNYLTLLLIGSQILTLLFVWHETASPMSLLFLLSSPVIINVIIRSYKAQQPEGFDPLLKPLALSTLLYSVLLGLGLLWAV